jgi:hypothetical protein
MACHTFLPYSVHSTCDVRGVWFVHPAHREHDIVAALNIIIMKCSPVLWKPGMTTAVGAATSCCDMDEVADTLEPEVCLSPNHCVSYYDAFSALLMHQTTC